MAEADVTELLEPHTPTVREVFVALRELVRDVAPDADPSDPGRLGGGGLDDMGRSSTP